jgi:hypothetical protein
MSFDSSQKGHCFLLCTLGFWRRGHSFKFIISLKIDRTGVKHRTDSAWKQGGRGGGWRQGQEGEMTQTMYAHVNK